MWKKKVEAGILLYALLMVAIFSLVLTFYLNRQVATQRNLVLEREKVTAYALATLSKKDGTASNVGATQTKTEGAVITVAVDLKTGRSYQFTFPKGEDEEKKEEKEKRKDTKKDKHQEEREASKQENKEKPPSSPSEQEEKRSSERVEE